MLGEIIKRKVLISILILLTSSASLYFLQDVEVREGYLLSQDAMLRYISWSPRAEPKGLAVLYHGFGGSSEMMGWIGFELARRGYLVVSYDARGHGKSSSSLSYDKSVLLQDFRLINEEFNCSSGEILLIGHSMGGRAVQELAPLVKPSKIVVIASPPLDESVSSKLLVLAGLDEIFPSNMVRGLNSWHVHVSAFDDHLTILYSPNSIEKIVSWLSGDSKTTVPLRLALTLISSLSAISVLILLPLALIERLEAKSEPGKRISAKVLLILVLFAPISSIFLISLTKLLRAPIASFILGIFYSQALGLTLIYRKDLSRVKRIFGEMKFSSLGSAMLLAFFAYLMMHFSLQPFLNVEPSVFRLPLIVELSLLFIPAVLIFETLTPHGSIQLNFLQRLTLMLVSFITASLVLQILVGGGYAGYFLIVMYMSLILLIPIELLASVLASRGLEALNPIWISIVLGLLLGAVTPIT